MSTFNKVIKELRLSKNTTQKQLAKDLNITERTIQNYEAGQKMPSTDLLISIADYFNVSLDYLTGRTDNPEIQ